MELPISRDCRAPFEVEMLRIYLLLDLGAVVAGRLPLVAANSPSWIVVLRHWTPYLVRKSVR